MRRYRHRASITSRLSAPTGRYPSILGRRAGHALRLRAAEPRRARGEPPLLRPGRRAADHGLHQTPSGRCTNPQGIGNLHHIAFTVSRAAYLQVVKRLGERGISSSGEVDPRLHGLDLFATRWGNCTSWLRTVRAAHGLYARGALRGAQDPQRARRLQHRRGTPGRRHRSADAAGGAPLSEDRSRATRTGSAAILTQPSRLPFGGRRSASKSPRGKALATRLMRGGAPGIAASLPHSQAAFAARMAAFAPGIAGIFAGILAGPLLPPGLAAFPAPPLGSPASLAFSPLCRQGWRRSRRPWDRGIFYGILTGPFAARIAAFPAPLGSPASLPAFLRPFLRGWRRSTLGSPASSHLPPGMAAFPAPLGSPHLYRHSHRPLAARDGGVPAPPGLTKP